MRGGMPPRICFYVNRQLPNKQIDRGISKNKQLKGSNKKIMSHLTCISEICYNFGQK